VDMLLAETFKILVVAEFERGGVRAREIPRPAGENAGLRDDAGGAQW
jgi:hypothetical protein